MVITGTTRTFFLQSVKLSAATERSKALMVFETLSRRVFSGPALARNQLVVSISLHAAPSTQVPGRDELHKNNTEGKH
jgi:hypothetical protein